MHAIAQSGRSVRRTGELHDLLQSSGCEMFRFLLILSSVGAIREYQLQQCAQDDSRPQAASAHLCVPFGWLTLSTSVVIDKLPRHALRQTKPPGLLA